MHRQTGDQGQRYAILAVGYPKEGENPIGYSKELKSAKLVAEGIQKAPSCQSAWVLDRETNIIVAWFGEPPETHIICHCVMCVA